jgi:hypothetical protein
MVNQELLVRNESWGASNRIRKGRRRMHLRQAHPHERWANAKGESGAPPVLVQREMESGRARLASITPIPRGQFAPPEACRPDGSVAAWRKGASGRNGNWFHKKGNQVGGSQSQPVGLRSGKQLARKRVSNTRTAKLLNKQPCRCHHAGAFVLRGTATEAAPCFSFRIGRHPGPSAVR